MMIFFNINTGTQTAVEAAAAATVGPDTRQPLAHHWFLLYFSYHGLE